MRPVVPHARTKNLEELPREQVNRGNTLKIGKVKKKMKERNLQQKGGSHDE